MEDQRTFPLHHDKQTFALDLDKQTFAQDPAQAALTQMILCIFSRFDHRLFTQVKAKSRVMIDLTKSRQILPPLSSSSSSGQDLRSQDAQKQLSRVSDNHGSVHQSSAFSQQPQSSAFSQQPQPSAFSHQPVEGTTHTLRASVLLSAATAASFSKC